MDYKLTIITPVSFFSIKDVESFFLMLKKQTNQNFECILVINGEKNVIERALSLLSSCNVPNNVVIAVDYSDTYIGGARNFGINQANGKYISFVDLDDALNERFVEVTLRIIESEVDAIVYNYSILSISANGTKSIMHKNIIEREEVISGKEASELCVSKLINKPCWNKVFKKEKLKNPFFLNCNGEDYCIPLILKKCSRVYLSIFESYIYYLKRTSSSHKSDYENCLYSLLLSAIVLSNFGLPYISQIMSLNREDYYRIKVVLKTLNMNLELKTIITFFRNHKKCITGKFSLKCLPLFLLSKTSFTSNILLRLKKENVFTKRMKDFLELYLNDAVLSFEKFK